ncbi:MAG: fibrobacter succinogenes major paralogous domain-containing protein [Alistipes sp.]|nr:fibrobacter succinogenes major paralogous domain-containing protein [Alistipes sp.]
MLLAAGYRVNSTGVFNVTSTQGLYWSASQSANTSNPERSSNLNINSGNVNPANYNPRANGFSVRCVAAFKERVAAGNIPAIATGNT